MLSVKTIQMECLVAARDVCGCKEALTSFYARATILLIQKDLNVILPNTQNEFIDIIAIPITNIFQQDGAPDVPDPKQSITQRNRVRVES